MPRRPTAASPAARGRDPQLTCPGDSTEPPGPPRFTAALPTPEPDLSTPPASSLPLVPRGHVDRQVAEVIGCRAALTDADRHILRGWPAAVATPASDVGDRAARQRPCSGLEGIASCRRRASAVVGPQCNHQWLWGNGSKSVHAGNGASRRGQGKRAAVQLRLHSGLLFSPRR